jgi:hypothetical protein
LIEEFQQLSNQYRLTKEEQVKLNKSLENGTMKLKIKIEEMLEENELIKKQKLKLHEKIEELQNEKKKLQTKNDIYQKKKNQRSRMTKLNK